MLGDLLIGVTCPVGPRRGFLRARFRGLSCDVVISFRKAVGISETRPVKTQGKCLRFIHNFNIQSHYLSPGACPYIRPRNARVNQIHGPTERKQMCNPHGPHIPSERSDCMAGPSLVRARCTVPAVFTVGVRFLFCFVTLGQRNENRNVDAVESPLT